MRGIGFVVRESERALEKMALEPQQDRLPCLLIMVGDQWAAATSICDECAENISCKYQIVWHANKMPTNTKVHARRV
jgi:hypothetical protein